MNLQEDVFHFISYLPINGRLYELDGLKEGPVDLGVIDGQNWLDVVRPVIEKRIQKYSEGEIHFNLMAIVSDRQMLCQRQLDELLNDNSMETDSKQSEIAKLRMQIDDEIVKRKRYKVRRSKFWESPDKNVCLNFRSRTFAASTTISHLSSSFCGSWARRDNCRRSTRRPSSAQSNGSQPRTKSLDIMQHFVFEFILKSVFEKLRKERRKQKLKGRKENFM